MFLNCIPRRKILDTSRIPKQQQKKSLFFDDLVNAPDRIQSKIANHWTDGRHHGNFSDFIFSQSYYDVPQKIRLKLFAHDSLSPSDKKNMWI